MLDGGLTLSEVLDLEAFRGARLVSACGGLRAIRTASVMEVPDVTEWVRPGELLITTLYPLRGDDEAQAGLIPKLAEREVAALAVKPRRFVETIPQAMIEAADRHRFPLVELPADAYFSRLLEALLHELTVREIERRQLDDFVAEWLSGGIADTERLLWRARRAGQVLAAGYRVLFLATGAPPDPAGPTSGAAAVQAVLRDRFAPASGYLVGALPDGVALLCPPGDDGSGVRAACATLEASGGDGSRWRVGMGRFHEGVENVPQSAAEAREAVAVADALGLDRGVTAYEDLGLLRFLHRLSRNAETDDFVDEVLRRLEAYDRDHRAQLLDTLAAFFARTGNARAVAGDLFVHYHTVLYRLERIRLVTGMNLDDPDDRLALQLALKLRQFRRDGAARPAAGLGAKAVDAPAR